MEMEVKQILQTLWRWRWLMLAVVGITILALGLTIILSKPEYQAKVKLQITTPEQETVALFEERRVANDRDAIVIARNNFRVVLDSDQVRNDTIEELGLVGADQDYKLEIVPIRDADFLDIVVAARTATLAADIANSHAQAAKMRMGELSALRSREAKNYFAKQLDKAKEEMGQAESELTAFQTDNGIVDAASALADRQLLLQQLELERNRLLFNEADSQTDVVSPIELLIAQRRGELEPLLVRRSTHGDLVNDVILADETYQTAVAAHQAVLEQYPDFNIDDPPEPLLEAEATMQDAESALQDGESALTEFLRVNDLVALEGEIGMLQNQIEQLGLERDRQLLAADDQLARQTGMLTSVNNLIAEREKEIDTLNSLEPQFNLLKVNVQQARARYDLVAGKYSEAGLKTDALLSADFLQVVSAAEPPKSAVSNFKKMTVFGLAGGIGAAVLLAFLMEYLHGFQVDSKSARPAAASKSPSQSKPVSSDTEFEGKPAV